MRLHASGGRTVGVSNPLAIWSYFGPVQSDSLQRGKAMFQAQVNLRKTLLGCTASALALSISATANAQNTTTGADKVRPKAASSQDAAQPAGTNAQKDEIVITGLRASIQASLDRKKRS